MNKPFLEITISPEGDVKLEGQGYVGGTCKDAARPYVAAFGTPAETTLKPEYHVQPKATNKRDVKS